MTNMRKLGVLFLFFVILSSCSTLNVTNDWDKEVDFNSFKSFSMYPWDKQNNQAINDYDKNNIINSVISEMQLRGYEYKEKGGELVVSLFVAIQNKTSYQAYTNHYGGWAGYGGGWGYYSPGWAYGYGYGPGYSSTQVTTREYEDGTLVIDIFSAADKKLIWQGIGNGEVEQDPGKRDKKLPKSISHIFRRYPIPKKQR